MQLNRTLTTVVSRVICPSAASTIWVTHWELTTTAIHQAKPDSYFKAARFGGAVDLKYNITPKIGINGAYRLIYDTAPIVPIRKTYTTVEAGLNIAF